MKKYVSILLVLLVVAALSVSGCTMLGGNGGKTATPTTTPGTTEPTTVTGPTTAATTAPSTSLGDTLGALYQKGKFSWYEYQYTMDMGEGQSIAMKMKMEMLGTGIDPKDGVSGEHMRSTVTMTMPGMEPQTTVTDVYSKPDTGSSSQSKDYSASTAKLVNEGTETVTVPAGTFTCTKYTVTDSDMEGTSTFWSSSKVPVPVKFAVTSEGTTMNMELVGWG
jgi:hypothetical protein